MPPGAAGSPPAMTNLKRTERRAWESALSVPGEPLPADIVRVLDDAYADQRMIAQSPKNKSIGSAPANKAGRPTCLTCGYFDADDDRCRKDPQALDRKPSDWCGQHTAFSEFLASLKAK